ncbi:glycosyltransferase [Congregibacter litoralis]|uniref:glycosyltransferase n=1 Tax=Congregibacter litoralis TaxID=393662 RepID=UPI001EE6695A|nr:glycosyltransferase [Congregibacter litoralis]
MLAGDEEGGLENHVVQLANHLVQLGINVSVAAHAKYEKRFSADVNVVPVDLSRSRNNPLALFEAARALQAIQADIVHAHASKAAAIVSRLSSWAPGKTVATVHSVKRKTRAFESMDALIGVSQGVLRAINHDKKYVVFNGLVRGKAEQVEPASLRAQLGIDDDLPVSLAVGRLVSVKRFDRLIRAWKPYFGHLLIVGDGPEKRHLESEIRKRNLQRVVRLLGYIDNARSLMSGADLLICSSEREGFSYTLAEALVSKLPVLSTRVAGAEEVLPGAFVVEHKDCSLQQGIERCLSDLERLNTDYEPVFTWASKHLTVENMAAETCAAYRDIMAAA